MTRTLSKLVLVIAVIAVIGLAIFSWNWLNTEHFLLKTTIQPRITPTMVINTKNVGAFNYICITAPNSDVILPNLKQDINLKIISGYGGGIYQDQQGYAFGTDNNITYYLEGTGGDYGLKVEFLHPDKWPKEITFSIYPTF